MHTYGLYIYIYQVAIPEFHRTGSLQRLYHIMQYQMLTVSMVISLKNSSSYCFDVEHITIICALIIHIVYSSLHAIVKQSTVAAAIDDVKNKKKTRKKYQRRKTHENEKKNKTKRIGRGRRFAWYVCVFVYRDATRLKARLKYCSRRSPWRRYNGVGTDYGRIISFAHAHTIILTPQRHTKTGTTERTTSYTIRPTVVGVLDF